MVRFLGFIIVLIFVLSSCLINEQQPLNEPPTMSAADPDSQIVITAEPGTPEAEAGEPETAPTISLILTEIPLTRVAENPPVQQTESIKNLEEESTRLLSAILPPVRDDFRLASIFRGVKEGNARAPSISELSLDIGTREKFKVLNVVDNTIGEIDAELLAVSDHAYFWFDIGPASPIPDQEKLLESAAAFDAIYETVVQHFGSESNPGIDGDPRLYIVNASPIALCGVTEDTADQCFLSGLVQPADLLPTSVDPRSNEHEMFVMNNYRFGNDYYLGVLAHEFRHMIEDNYDLADTDWEKEGSATLAAQLAGYPSGGIERGNMFLTNPDQQLNSWVEENTAPYYGQGYLLNRYIYDQLGEDLYLKFATSPLPGLKAIDSIAAENGLNLDGNSLWFDWLTALAIHDQPGIPDKYKFSSFGLDTARMTPVITVPSAVTENVSQYAADYYELPVDAKSFEFSGSPFVSLLSTAPTSGERFWYAQRGNNSNPRLTREIDLSGVDRATLSYQVYSDLEYGYDFAYVSVSTDGGETWTPIIGDEMQGQNPADNPARSALTDRFYTGRSRQWLNETIDLSGYSGKKILLRFEIVTDPILTYSGLALDDISIPEIGFYDDVEKDDLSWQAEGFVRTGEYLTQKWHIRLITFNDGGVQVQELEANPSGQTGQMIDSSGASRNPILIVASSAPTTLVPAEYHLKIN